MENIKIILEQEKVRLSILKNKLNCFQSDFHLKEKFYLEEVDIDNGKVYDIFQNLYSLPLLFSALKYPDAKICFFVELINFYQTLEENVLYQSFSQSFTTYCLKILGRNKIIDLVHFKNSKNVDLNSHMEMLGNFHYKNSCVPMYIVNFYKLRSLNEVDIPLIKNLAYFLDINLSILEFIYKNDKMYIQLRKDFAIQQIKNGTLCKNLFMQRKNIYTILKDCQAYFFEDFIDDFSYNAKQR